MTLFLSCNVKTNRELQSKADEGPRTVPKIEASTSMPKMLCGRANEASLPAIGSKPLRLSAVRPMQPHRQQELCKGLAFLAAQS